MSDDHQDAEAGANSATSPPEDPSNVNRVKLEFGDWKDALAEFISRHDGADENEDTEEDDSK